MAPRFVIDLLLSGDRPRRGLEQDGLNHERISGGIFLVASIAIALIWHLGLANDRVLTIAIAAVSLASILILDLPALRKSITRRGD